MAREEGCGVGETDSASSSHQRLPTGTLPHLIQGSLPVAQALREAGQTGGHPHVQERGEHPAGSGGEEEEVDSFEEEVRVEEEELPAQAGVGAEAEEEGDEGEGDSGQHQAAEEVEAEGEGEGGEGVSIVGSVGGSGVGMGVGICILVACRDCSEDKRERVEGVVGGIEE